MSTKENMGSEHTRQTEIDLFTAADDGEGCALHQPSM